MQWLLSYGKLTYRHWDLSNRRRRIGAERIGSYGILELQLVIALIWRYHAVVLMVTLMVVVMCAMEMELEQVD